MMIHRNIIRIVIWGAAYASQNIGDVAITRSLIEGIQKRNRYIQIILFTRGTYQKHIEHYTGVRLINPCLKPFTALYYLILSKMLVIAGGVPFRGPMKEMLKAFSLLLCAKLCLCKIILFSE